MVYLYLHVFLLVSTFKQLHTTFSHLKKKPMTVLKIKLNINFFINFTNKTLKDFLHMSLAY